MRAAAIGHVLEHDGDAAAGRRVHACLEPAPERRAQRLDVTALAPLQYALKRRGERGASRRGEHFFEPPPDKLRRRTLQQGLRLRVHVRVATLAIEGDEGLLDRFEERGVLRRLLELAVVSALALERERALFGERQEEGLRPLVESLSGAEGEAERRAHVDHRRRRAPRRMPRSERREVLGGVGESRRPFGRGADEGELALQDRARQRTAGRDRKTPIARGDVGAETRTADDLDRVPGSPSRRARSDRASRRRRRRPRGRRRTPLRRSARRRRLR